MTLAIQRSNLIFHCINKEKVVVAVKPNSRSPSKMLLTVTKKPYIKGLLARMKVCQKCLRNSTAKTNFILASKYMDGIRYYDLNL